MSIAQVSRRLPVGAELTGAGTEFRVWAPGRRRVEVIVSGRSAELAAEPGGYFSGTVAGAKAGDHYRYRLDGGAPFPDPASRFQPEGPHGPSEIIDAGSFQWSDGKWSGLPIENQVIYEMHVGTFTEGGTWEGALRELPALARMGVTVLEVMPIADFSGSFGWGYDGVNLFAPTRLYGRPDDLRTFVDKAHGLGMAVILDVVYNHVGADGNYLGQFAKSYFSEKYTTDWGDAINYDGPDSMPVREFFIANAGYWINEFHMDGLRLDATQNIYDVSSVHILSEITARVREAGGNRKTIVIAENEPQETKLVRPSERGGFGMDGLWNDDLHHSAVVALTSHNDAYYTDYLGSPQEFVSAMKYGYLYQGQWYKWQKKRRGTPAFDVPSCAFVTFIENHDQVANSARGLRMHQLTTPGLLKAMTALILLGPGTPMLFQGQEFASSKPFRYFADPPDDIAELVRKGRKEFVSQWRNISMPNMLGCMYDPCSPQTFDECKLDHSEREKHASVYRLHCDLIRLRREDPVLNSWRKGEFDGAILSSDSFLLRGFSAEHGDRLIVVNLGRDLELNPAPEPLLAPPAGHVWDLVLSTEEPQDGGCGTPPVDTEDNWYITGQTAVVLRPVVAPEEELKSE